MIDPRFHFQKTYHISPAGILNFFMIEGIKLQKKPSKYGLYKLTLNYAKNAYDLKNLTYMKLYYFLTRYQKFMKWLSKNKPIRIFE